jgi:hypothetical protein
MSNQVGKPMTEITAQELTKLRKAFAPLIGVQLDILKIPTGILSAFQPSQIGTIVGTLMDACIPHLDAILPSEKGFKNLGLTKAPGLLKDREGYPDYIHNSGLRLELKLLYIDPNDGLMKTTETPREPSARITQKVTLKNVLPDKDALLVIAYQLRQHKIDPGLYSPEVLDIGVFSMIECVRARDYRLKAAGGVWFGDYETPAILSKQGAKKLRDQKPLDANSYGRKESEGRDFNEDTNFGKLKRIPYQPLQEFLKMNGSTYSSSGDYPEKWSI